ncbi:hypothetical protein [Natrinema halophilum]|uniref:Uncharacterized protein n=1 Tax=Natrinema halophilum TaxID=1699371 RepID=A0A7D5GIV5_9EURY|nr:hypothetical protein [Natrinema halophilum]QLG50007.1 hypothetical protein HYG82_14655 [Natrinema halophilum]
MAISNTVVAALNELPSPQTDTDDAAGVTEEATETRFQSSLGVPTLALRPIRQSLVLQGFTQRVEGNYGSR